MKTKPILAVLAATVTGFLLGWLIFGILLANFYAENMISYPGLMKEPPAIWAILLGNLAGGVMYVYIFEYLAGIRTFAKGFVAGLVIAFLICFSFDIFMYGTMNLISGSILAVDIIANTVVGGLAAGVAAVVLGTGKKE